MRQLRSLGLAAAVALTAAGCWWPQVGNGPDRRAHNPAEGSLTVANVGSLAHRWTVALPSGASPPVVGPNGAYVTSDFDLRAFAGSSGEARWTRSFDVTWPPELRGLSAPLVRGDAVSVASQTYAAGGNTDTTFHTLDAATGATRATIWAPSTSYSSRGSSLAGFEVYGMGGDGSINTVQVVDVDTGASIWGGVITGSGTTPTLGRERLYAVESGATVVAYDVTTPCEQAPDTDARFCTPTWSVPVDGQPRAVVIGQDPATVFVGTSAGTLYALDAATGATRWTVAVGSAITATPAMADGLVYVPTAGGGLVAVDADGCGASTCPISWRGTTESSISAQPAVAGGVVYAGSTDGTVRAFPAAGCGAATCAAIATVDGEPFWPIPGDPTVTGLAVAAGSLYVSQANALIRYGA